MQLQDTPSTNSQAGNVAAVGLGCSGSIAILFVAGYFGTTLRSLWPALGNYVLAAGIVFGWALWMVLLEALGRRFHGGDGASHHAPRKGPWIGVLVASTWLFHVEATARWGGPLFAAGWLGLLAWSLSRLAVVFDDCFQCSPEPAVRRVVRRNIATTTLFIALMWAYWTPLPVCIFVWRHADALRTACTTGSLRGFGSPEPPGFEGWANMVSRHRFGPDWDNYCCFDFRFLDSITIFYAPDANAAAEANARPQHLFGPWYFEEH